MIKIHYGKLFMDSLMASFYQFITDQLHQIQKIQRMDSYNLELIACIKFLLGSFTIRFIKPIGSGAWIPAFSQPENDRFGPSLFLARGE